MILRMPARLSLVLPALCVAATLSPATAAGPAVTFGSPGGKQVNLIVCNQNGCSSITRTVVVLDPHPAVTAMSVTPWSVLRGNSVHLAGTAQGAPPLTFTWRILTTTGIPVATLSGAAVDWSTSQAAAGDYVIYLDASNSFGSHTPLPSFVTVVATSLPFSDGFESGTDRWASTTP